MLHPKILTNRNFVNQQVSAGRRESPSLPNGLHLPLTLLALS